MSNRSACLRCSLRYHLPLPSVHPEGGKRPGGCVRGWASTAAAAVTTTAATAAAMAGGGGPPAAAASTPAASSRQFSGLARHDRTPIPPQTRYNGAPASTTLFHRRFHSNVRYRRPAAVRDRGSSCDSGGGGRSRAAASSSSTAAKSTSGGSPDCASYGSTICASAAAVVSVRVVHREGAARGSEGAGQDAAHARRVRRVRHVARAALDVQLRRLERQKRAGSPSELAIPPRLSGDAVATGGRAAAAARAAQASRKVLELMHPTAARHAGWAAVAPGLPRWRQAWSMHKQGTNSVSLPVAATRTARCRRTGDTLGAAAAAAGPLRPSLSPPVPSSSLARTRVALAHRDESGPVGGQHRVDVEQQLLDRLAVRAAGEPVEKNGHLHVHAPAPK